MHRACSSQINTSSLYTNSPKDAYNHASTIYHCKIDWNEPIDTIYNKIRGLSPYPTSWTIIDNQNENIEAKIYSASKTLEEHQYSTGSIITTKTELKIAVKDGFILINEIQLPGKRKMNVKDLLNGYAFNAYSKMC